jgi:hypothetical protein
MCPQRLPARMIEGRGVVVQHGHELGPTGLRGRILFHRFARSQHPADQNVQRRIRLKRRTSRTFECSVHLTVRDRPASISLTASAVLNTAVAMKPKFETGSG